VSESQNKLGPRLPPAKSGLESHVAYTTFMKISVTEDQLPLIIDTSRSSVELSKICYTWQKWS